MPKVSTTVYIEEEQQTALFEIAQRDGVSIASIIRDGITTVLRRRGASLPLSLEERVERLEGAFHASTNGRFK